MCSLSLSVTSKQYLLWLSVLSPQKSLWASYSLASLFIYRHISNLRGTSRMPSKLWGSVLCERKVSPEKNSPQRTPAFCLYTVILRTAATVSKSRISKNKNWRSRRQEGCQLRSRTVTHVLTSDFHFFLRVCSAKKSWLIWFGTVFLCKATHCLCSLAISLGGQRATWFCAKNLPSREPYRLPSHHINDSTVGFVARNSRRLEMVVRW